jgi:hypothetical protein
MHCISRGYCRVLKGPCCIPQWIGLCLLFGSHLVDPGVTLALWLGPLIGGALHAGSQHPWSTHRAPRRLFDSWKQLEKLA